MSSVRPNYGEFGSLLSGFSGAVSAAATIGILGVAIANLRQECSSVSRESDFNSYIAILVQLTFASKRNHHILNVAVSESSNLGSGSWRVNFAVNLRWSQRDQLIQNQWILIKLRQL